MYTSSHWLKGFVLYENKMLITEDKKILLSDAIHSEMS